MEICQKEVILWSLKKYWKSWELSGPPWTAESFRGFLLPAYGTVIGERVIQMRRKRGQSVFYSNDFFIKEMIQWIWKNSWNSSPKFWRKYMFMSIKKGSI